ncbi:TPA: ead/Ea22-like family protein, partial [Citrobacter koseri]|nr:ead/Ea22-like family protein [Citrobacter koseri]
ALRDIAEKTKIAGEAPVMPFEQRINALNDFMKNFTPATMLALLDELEAKDRRIEEEIGRANREHHRGFMMACGHLKEHANAHYADAAEMEIEALRKRIAELEAKLANPVLLPKTNGYWTEQEKAYEEAITFAKRQVRLAGFRCEGDE